MLLSPISSCNTSFIYLEIYSRLAFVVHQKIVDDRIRSIFVDTNKVLLNYSSSFLCITITYRSVCRYKNILQGNALGSTFWSTIHIPFQRVQFLFFSDTWFSPAVLSINPLFVYSYREYILCYIKKEIK